MSFIENLRRNILFRKFRNYVSNVMYGDQHFFMSDVYAENLNAKLIAASEKLNQEIANNLPVESPNMKNKVGSIISQAAGLVQFTMDKYDLDNITVTQTDGVTNRTMTATFTFSEQTDD